MRSLLTEGQLFFALLDVLLHFDLALLALFGLQRLLPFLLKKGAEEKWTRLVRQSRISRNQTKARKHANQGTFLLLGDSSRGRALETNFLLPASS